MSQTGGKVMDANYMEILEKAVLEEGQVVTYKWLCHELGTSANKAKQMLFAFAEAQKELGTSLEVTYLLAGMKKWNNTKSETDSMVHNVCVVPSSMREEYESTFTIVTSVHIYSISKNVLSDMDVLYSVDYDLESTFNIKRASSIVSDGCTLRSDAPIAMRTEQPFVQPTIQKSTVDQQNGNGDKVLKEESVSAKTAVSIKKTKEVKGNRLSSMFATMAVKKRNPTSQESPPTQSAPLEETQKEDVVKMEAKASSPSDVSNLASTPTQKVAVTQARDTNLKMLDTNEKPNKLPGKRSHDKRKKSIDKSDPPKKRRRRIIEMSDSSSDEDSHHVELDEESEDAISNATEAQSKVVGIDHEDESDEDPLQPLRPQNDESCRNRKQRRLVEETVQDEDGYLSTRKKWIECSDEEAGNGVVDDDDENAKQTTTAEQKKIKTSPESATTTAKKPAKVITPPAKNKQATLTSFFKRK